MRRGRLAFFASIVVLVALVGGAARAESLEYERRVEAHRAVERVLWERRIWPESNGGPKPPLEAVLPESELRDRVDEVLRKSNALGEIWSRRVGNRELQAELDRMARDSRAPDVLEAMFEALGHDPVLVAEAIARPALVDRLVRSWHGGDASDFDAWWSMERRRHAAYLPDVDDPVAISLPSPSRASSSFSCADDTWTAMGVGEPSPRHRHSAVWTGSEMILWGGTEPDYTTQLGDGARYNPATDTWSPMSAVGAPSARSEQGAVWTGTRMVIWGGIGPASALLDTGGRYDPTTDSWTPTATAGAPGGRRPRVMVWTGSRVIVWGGAPFDPGELHGTGGRYDPVSDSWTPTSLLHAPFEPVSTVVAAWTGSLLLIWPGGRYDPVADVWSDMSSVGEPSNRSEHAGVWTGSRLIVWGGFNSTFPLQTGGRYDPSTDTWTPTSLTGAPEGRGAHTAVWLAGRMVVWGGTDYDPPSLKHGGRYDPSTDTWSLTTTVGEPASRRFRHTAIATPTEMIVWGGDTFENVVFGDGGRYDPVSNTWLPVRSSGATPEAVSGHSAVWTGAELVVWGGIRGSDQVQLKDGGRYDPATATWRPTNAVGAPSNRNDHTAIWTGTRMLVWGGRVESAFASTGGSYDPTLDVWSAVSNAGAPEGRTDHTAVWTGAWMIVWGGANGSGDLTTGGRYDPVSNTWSATSLSGAPAARSLHTAVWGGGRMIVWGGSGLFTGGRYDPAVDSWTATAIANAPSARKNHVSVWTGSRMLVWGGENGGDLATGSSYDPVSDAWTTLSSSGAPLARRRPSAVWTGAEMIVWGGISGALRLDSGGRYRPEADTWQATSLGTAPVARALHGAVWSGSAMFLWGGSVASGDALDDGASYCACVSWYPDADGDGYGATFGETTTCDGSRPAGTIAITGDCNDGNPAVHPGLSDATCDEVDQDCDGELDEDFPNQPSTCGLGVCHSFGFLECIGGQVQNTCVPNLPNAPVDDSCNTLDDDCDGGVDEDFPQREDYWSAIANAPSSRTNHTAVWSGSEMIVFGGDNGSGSVQTGGNAYAPASNTWRTLAAGPLKRWHHTAVWTGSRMIVWGGDDNTATIYNTGSRYDPATDTWATTTTTGAPTARFSHSAVWTGTRMIVWGGHDPLVYLNTGSRYDPVANTWSATTTTGAPAIRAGHSAVWTGTEMIVWGGLTTGQVAVGTGSRYNPTTNTWTAVTTTGAPSARFGHVALWTGSEMIVWGGTTDGVTYLAGGARYNPVSNSWTPITTVGGPGRRAFASAVGTGTQAIVWGGTYRTNEDPDTPLFDGFRYDPATDSWTAMNDQLAVPAARARAAAVWTGSEMIAWGGDPNGGALSTGGRYNPRTVCGTGGCQRVGTTFCSGAAIAFACNPAPSMPEICDGIDNDCDVAVDEGIPVPSAHPAVLGTKLSAGGNATYAWSNTPDTTGYDTVRGVLGTLRSSAGNFTIAVDACLGNDLPAASVQDPAAPVAGGGYWYLVRPVNACSGAGTYDETIPPQQGSRDAEIAASAAACP